MIGRGSFSYAEAYAPTVLSRATSAPEIGALGAAGDGITQVHPSWFPSKLGIPVATFSGMPRLSTVTNDQLPVADCGHPPIDFALAKVGNDASMTAMVRASPTRSRFIEPPPPW